MKYRYAPTPSGFLHIGNALNFILNWHFARQSPDGKILLRIDDLDAERKRPEYIQDIFDTLTWLGLDYDEGPKNAADFENNWTQKLRLPLYEEALQKLAKTGQVFACTKSRKELAPFGDAYPKIFREQDLPLHTPDAAWRIKTPENFPLQDFVIRRRDGVPAYQIASLVDDVLFGVTHIIRGEDLRDSTEAQIFLAQVLDNQAFLNIEFTHHALIKNEQGEKLSKSAGSTALKTMREEGRSPDFIWRLFYDGFLIA